LTAGRGPLADRRILVVEDDFNIASLLAMVLEADGAEIVGPVGTIKGALALIANGARIDGAILDVNLRGEMIYPVADVLRRKGVPMVFLTGYDERVLAPGYADVPCFQKPVDHERLIHALFG
jgi:DNA-binding response OmpR family regulator